MRVTIKDNTSKWLVIDELHKISAESRFKFEIHNDYSSTKGFDIKMVRLKEKREYCGNHPNACEFTGVSNRKATWLEGADWVEFNDRVNDVLDRLGVAANVYSAVCWLRKGALRRINYGSHPFPYNPRIWEWDKYGEPDDYENYCHREAPASDYPEGTPGSYERLSNESV